MGIKNICFRMADECNHIDDDGISAFEPADDNRYFVCTKCGKKIRNPFVNNDGKELTPDEAVENIRTALQISNTVWIFSLMIDEMLDTIGCESGVDELVDKLEEEGASYDEFVMNMLDAQLTAFNKYATDYELSPQIKNAVIAYKHRKLLEEWGEIENAPQD